MSALTHASAGVALGLGALALGAVGWAALACAAQAQPRGFYPSPWTADYAYDYRPPLAYGPDGRYMPYVYPNGYDGYHVAAVIAGRAPRGPEPGAERASGAATPWRSPPRRGRASPSLPGDTRARAERAGPP